jgi:hypothetical protein
MSIQTEFVETIRKAILEEVKGLSPAKNKFLQQKKGYKLITKPGYTP